MIFVRLADLFSFRARVGEKPMLSKPRSRREWEEFAEELVEKIEEALDYWCWNVTGESAYECYIHHSDRDLGDLANEFVGWSSFGITETDLELLEEMPEDIYDKYTRKIQKDIERVVKELERKYGKPEEVW